jgi:hypothetical protein
MVRYPLRQPGAADLLRSTPAGSLEGDRKKYNNF